LAVSLLVASANPASADGAMASAPAGVIAAVSSHGKPASPPIEVSGSQWLVIVGATGTPSAVWSVTQDGGAWTATFVDSLPVGVTITGSYVDDSEVYLFLTTLAVRDQPANLRTVLPLDLGVSEQYRDVATMVHLAGTVDRADLVRRIAPSPTLETASDAAPTALQAASSAVALAALLAPGGVTVYRPYQDTFLAPVATVDASGLASSPYLGALRAAVAGVDEDGCSDGVCATGVAGDYPLVVLDPTTATARITALVLPPDPGTYAPVAPHVVRAATSTATAQTLFTQYYGSPATVLAQAPLDASGGVLAVAVNPSGEELDALVSEGTEVSLLPIRDFADPEKATTAFADVDGDGRTDLVLHFDTFVDAGPANLVFLTPRSLARWDMVEDVPSELQAQGLTTLAAALPQMLTAPQRGVDAATALPLLQAAMTARGLAKVAAPGYRLFSYSEPAEPTTVFVTHAHPFAKGGPGVTEPDCGQITCDSMRPVCYDVCDGVSADYHVFTWVKGALRLAAQDLYGGT
jgi:hypothetical protein